MQPTLNLARGNLSDLIMDTLRNMIVDGRLHPSGDRSITPVVSSAAQARTIEQNLDWFAQWILLSIPLSIDPDIIRRPDSWTTADHAIRQRFTAFLPDFLLPFGRLISVRSVVQLYPGP